jgi:D-inositol-3-phosphate glycosyltransferase
LVPSDKMKILYVLDFFYPHVGGVPTLFLNLAQEMIRLGHNVTVLTTWPERTKKVENYKGIKIIRLGKKREDFLFKASFHLLFTKEKFDIIHTSTYSAMIPAFLVQLLRRIPAVVSVHEIWSFREMLEFYGLKGLIYFIEQKILLSLPFRYYFSPSLHTKKDLQAIGVNRKKIVLIPHGIDEKIFNPSVKRLRKQVRRKIGVKDSDIVGLFIGKPTVFKGIEYLLDAIRMLKTNTKFIFVLSPLYGKEREKFLSIISSEKVLKEKIIVLENREEPDYIAKLIGASDFLVMPSLSEGFGFAVAEAASVGIPTIVTRGTSLTEVVEENKNAIYVKQRDAKGLAQAIERLAIDKKLREKLSRRKRFKSWKEVVSVYQKVYQNAILKHKEV